jgi:hypothetical protein
VKLFLSIVQLLLTFWIAWAKADSEKKQKTKDLKQEVNDAIKSGDISRVNILIHRIRGL